VKRVIHYEMPALVVKLDIEKLMMEFILKTDSRCLVFGKV